MGCSSSVKRGVVAKRTLRHDVCITCTSPVLSSEDFSGFFSVWIMKICDELSLSAIAGRPNLGSIVPREGSRQQLGLKEQLLTSRVAVCILNMTRGAEMPPPGYKAEMRWAEECNIPVVPFYDGDRYTPKEVSAWRKELPALFRNGLGPV
ncbi:unnamed protein product, partial [Polarella glacialis]